MCDWPKVMQQSSMVEMIQNWVFQVLIQNFSHGTTHFLCMLLFFINCTFPGTFSGFYHLRVVQLVLKFPNSITIQLVKIWAKLLAEHMEIIIHYFPLEKPICRNLPNWLVLHLSIIGQRPGEIRSRHTAKGKVSKPEGRPGSLMLPLHPKSFSLQKLAGEVMSLFVRYIFHLSDPKNDPSTKQL